MNSIVFENDDYLIVDKKAGAPVQNDETGRSSLAGMMALRNNGFDGLIHRLDTPTHGLVVFAKHKKAQSALSGLFQTGEVDKMYLAVTDNLPVHTSGTMVHYLIKKSANKSSAYTREVHGSKKAVLSYRVLGSSDRYHLLAVTLETGRHHQIRAQFAAEGIHIRGDVKYGAKRPNQDRSIDLVSFRISFKDPLTGTVISAEAALPHDPLWNYFRESFQDIQKSH